MTRFVALLLSPAAVQIFKDRGIDFDFQPNLGKDKESLSLRVSPLPFKWEESFHLHELLSVLSLDVVSPVSIPANAQGEKRPDGQITSDYQK